MSYIKWFEQHSLKHKNIVDKLLKKGFVKDQIIDYFDYDNMVKNEVSFCPLYAKDKKCHDMDELNCYLCACPNFRFNDNGIKKYEDKQQYSFCNIDSKDGKQSTYGDKIHQNCSLCTIPHHKDYIYKYFEYDWKIIMKDCKCQI